GSGQDTFTFDDGATLSGAIDGGAGSSNTLDYSRYTSGVSVDLSTGKAQGTGGVSHIDHLIGGSASDVLTGDDKANVIAGGPGDDIIDGGGGADTVDYGSATGAVTVNLSSQSATGGGGADTVRNVENIVGSPFDDTLTGDGNANVIRGGPGDDIIDGGGGADTVDYGGAPGAVTVNLTTMSATGGAGTDTLQDVENIIGSPFDDTLTGDGNANVIQGGPGDDALAGGPGDDTYLLVGHWGFDTVFEAAGGGGDSLVVEGSPDNDIFSVGTGIVERKDPATLAVTDNVAYGDGIESLRVDGGSGPADRIVLGGSLSLDQSVSFSADEITIAQDIFAAGGITATAEEALTVEAGVTLSTRRVSGLDHENGISTGDSGDITLKAPYTQLLSGSKLLAHVEAGGGYSPGKITLSARAGSDATGDLLRVEDIGSRVTLSDAIIKGGTVTIGADTDTDTAFGDIEDLGDTASFTLEAIGQFSVIGGWSVSKALSEVDIGPGTHIEAVDAEIRAGAKTTAKIMTIFTALGVSYGESDPRARVLVRDGASITATGDLDIHTTADSTMKISAYALNLGPERGKKWDLTAAVSKADIESTVRVSQGATLQVGGDLTVQAETHKSHSTSALGGAYADGNLGAGVAISLCTTNTNALVDGTVTVDGDVRIAATSHIPKNDISASAASGSGLLVGMMLKIPTAGLNKIREWTDRHIPSAESNSKLGVAAAVAYAEDTNNAEARIGDNASVVSGHGGIAVNSSISDVPEISANATVDSAGMAGKHKKENAAATAIVVGDFQNHADSHIGSGATVMAADVISVDSEALIPYDVQWDSIKGPGDIDDYLNSNLGIQNAFFTSWARSAATVDDIGVAGSVNVVRFNNTSSAFIDENATVLQDTLRFNPSEIVIDPDGTGKIHLGSGHGLSPGDRVVYNNGGGTDLEGLESGQAYYVLFDASDPEYIKLAPVPEGSAFALDTTGVSGSNHLLYKSTLQERNDLAFDPSRNAVTFDPTAMTGRSTEMVLGDAHHFYDGEAVVYENGIEHVLNASAFLDQANHAFFLGENHGLSDGDAVVYHVEGPGLTGLTDGNTYYVVEATETQVKLANTVGGPAIAIDFPGGSPYGALNTTVHLNLKDLGALVNGETYYVRVVDAHTIRLSDRPGGSPIVLDYDRAKGILQTFHSKEAVYVGTHAFETGDAVVYGNGGGLDIKGLTHGATYYVIRENASHIRLAATREKALNGVGLEIDASGAHGAGHTFSSLSRGVTVKAASNIETVNFAGVYGINPKRFFMSGADTAGVGVSYLDVSYEGRAVAEVRDEALVSAGSLKVEAGRDNKEISIAVSGGKAKKFGASGSISNLRVENDGIDTLAHISDKAVVVTQDLLIPDVDASLQVSAHDHSRLFNVTGGVLLGANTGIGASVAVNRIERDTLAVIGNMEEDAPGCGSLFAQGDISVSAVNDGEIDAFTVAAAVAFQSKSKPGAGADLGVGLPDGMPEGTGKFGLQVSGAVAHNTIRDTARAYIRDAEVRRADDVKIYARNHSDISSIAGSAAFAYSGNDGTSMGLAGAYSRNVVADTTEAFIEETTVSASGCVSLTSLASGDIFAVTASGSGQIRDKAVAVAGSVSINETDNATQSYIDSATLQHVDRLSLAATDESKINADGGGVALALGAGGRGSRGSVAVGAGLAWNDISNEVRAFAEETTITVSGNVYFSALSDSEIQSVSMAGAISVGASGTGSGFALGGAGAASFNEIDNTIEAYVKATGGITSASGEITIEATDSAEILANAVGGSIVVGAGGSSSGGALSIGVSLAHNTISNRTLAYIDNSGLPAPRDAMVLDAGK
ncbi:MAG: hypothetical protein JRF59_15685, partial [Deltaproteobacteria bacterium]|nr:hypothetical protein [Deltaproteobacteria bacterium]